METHEISTRPRLCRRAELKKSELSPNWARLVELMQSVGFGCIQRLQIRDGEPDFETQFRVRRTVKIAVRDGPHLTLARKDFVLKQEVIELLDHFRHLERGIIERLEIRHGLPFLFEFELTETVLQIQEPR